MKHIIETERLFLREMELKDKADLSNMLCDRKSMKYYPSRFTKEQVENWIKWNIENYKNICDRSSKSLY